MRVMRSAPHSIFFDDWRARIQGVTEVPELLRVVRAYLAGWTQEQLSHLPYIVAAPVLPDPDSIIMRAAVASREESTFRGSSIEYGLLREMSWTFSAAATRLRVLRSIAPHTIH